MQIRSRKTRGPTGVHFALERDQGMSRVHFLVEYNPPLARVGDLRSKNGTFVNRQKVDHTELRNGDEIRAGQTTFRVKLPTSAGPLRNQAR